nr:reverse transcriptase domain-containing protein [Tanacetum cinerariifolium]
MKLNPKKYTFGVKEGMFLGYKVNTKGIKVCPDKADVVLSLPSSKCLKDVQKLNGKLASLNRLHSRTARRGLSGYSHGDRRRAPKTMDLVYRRMSLCGRFRSRTDTHKFRRNKIHLCSEIQANVDSRLVANQVNGTYIAKEAEMIQYLEKVRALTNGFRMFSIKQVTKSENEKADVLSKITSTSFAHLSKQVLVEELKEKSISEVKVVKPA